MPRPPRHPSPFDPHFLHIPSPSLNRSRHISQFFPRFHHLRKHHHLLTNRHPPHQPSRNSRTHRHWYFHHSRHRWPTHLHLSPIHHLQSLSQHHRWPTHPHRWPTHPYLSPIHHHRSPFLRHHWPSRHQRSPFHRHLLLGSTSNPTLFSWPVHSHPTNSLGWHRRPAPKARSSRTPCPAPTTLSFPPPAKYDRPALWSDPWWWHFKWQPLTTSEARQPFPFPCPYRHARSTGLPPFRRQCMASVLPALVHRTFSLAPSRPCPPVSRSSVRWFTI